MVPAPPSFPAIIYSVDYVLLGETGSKSDVSVPPGIVEAGKPARSPRRGQPERPAPRGGPSGTANRRPGWSGVLPGAASPSAGPSRSSSSAGWCPRADTGQRANGSLAPTRSAGRPGGMGRLPCGPAPPASAVARGAQGARLYAASASCQRRRRWRQRRRWRRAGETPGGGGGGGAPGRRLQRRWQQAEGLLPRGVGNGHIKARGKGHGGSNGKGHEKDAGGGEVTEPTLGGGGGAPDSSGGGSDRQAAVNTGRGHERSHGPPPAAPPPAPTPPATAPEPAPAATPAEGETPGKGHGKSGAPGQLKK